MHSLLRVALVLGSAKVLLSVVALPLAAQVATNQTAEALLRMREDLAAERYAEVIAEANGLLESARVITTPLRIDLWQLLAAAYYPEAPTAQQPDSARLPIEALIRLVPDFKIARELSWSGLDELTEQVRAESFSVVTRPLSEYTLVAPARGYLTVVASRPVRFRLSSSSAAGGRVVIHDSSAFVRVAVLQLRTHDALGPIFTDGVHQLHLWAYDSVSGDSLRIVHRATALRSDLPPPIAERIVAASEPAVEPSPRPVPPQAVATSRSAMLWGGLALAAATVVFAQKARPDGELRKSFRADSRAIIAGAGMSAAAVTNFFIGGSPERNVVPVAVVPAAPIPTSQPANIYRVRLRIDPPER